MQVFISHNKADAETARLFATTLAEQGVGTWFDEWDLRPGDSIIDGIERGLSNADVFVLFWSAQAASSQWVGTEVRAYLRRRVDDGTLRIVPLMLDETPLPVLVADYLGFRIIKDADLVHAATEITGTRSVHGLVARLAQVKEIGMPSLPRIHLPVGQLLPRQEDYRDTSTPTAWFRRGVFGLSATASEFPFRIGRIHRKPSS